MLRIAVPNKGSLSGPASAMLHEAGYQQRQESKELRIVDPENEVEFFYLRPRDIAIYVSSGQLDIGITGRDLLIDSGANAEEILPLGFARSTFRYATKPGTANGVEDFGGHDGRHLLRGHRRQAPRRPRHRRLRRPPRRRRRDRHPARRRRGHRGRRRDRHQPAQRRAWRSSASRS